MSEKPKDTKPEENPEPQSGGTNPPPKPTFP